jgi:type I restriction enzyme S subunit
VGYLFALSLGKATILPIGIDYTLSANVILIQPIEHVATPEYLQFFLSSPREGANKSLI